jgi:hypothetical protein
LLCSWQVHQMMMIRTIMPQVFSMLCFSSFMCWNHWIGRWVDEAELFEWRWMEHVGLAGISTYIHLIW